MLQVAPCMGNMFEFYLPLDHFTNPLSYYPTIDSV